MILSTTLIDRCLLVHGFYTKRFVSVGFQQMLVDQKILSSLVGSNGIGDLNYNAHQSALGWERYYKVSFFPAYSLERI